MSIVYLTDSLSRIRMENFFNTNMSMQNISENINNWIGGEYYIQTSLYYIIKHIDNILIIDIDTIIDFKILDDCVLIISPGWLEIPEQFKKYKTKLYSYKYFDNIVLDFDKRIITPFVYNNNHYNIPITPIPLPINSECSIDFNKYNISGLLVGKCISHVVAKNAEHNLIELINSLNSKLFTTLRDLTLLEKYPEYIISCADKCNITIFNLIHNKNIINLGILNVIDFRYLLKYVKYVLFYNGAFSPPTLIEALDSECIILSTLNVLPHDLKENKNIIIIDNLSNNEINNIIYKIEQGEIIFIKDEYPTTYTIDNKIKTITNLIEYHNIHYNAHTS